jgi:UDP-glucose:(heptosyl)LPS alpha-1,3-glucosyltransferase
MKIAVVRKECGFGFGGAERYCANLCRCLADMGHQVYVVGRECDDDVHPDIIHIPVKVSNRTSAARNLSFHLNSQRAVKRLAVDRVFALSRTFPADAFRVSDPLHATWMNIRYPGRLRNFFEGLNPRHRAILSLERNICDPNNTRAIITNSAWAKKQVREVYTFPEERIHVIYNGVDLDRFRPGEPVGTEKGPLRLLFVAQDFGRKGLGFIVEALARLTTFGVDCRLKVVGRDDPRPFRHQAERLGVAGLIDFSGPSGQVEDCYRSADLLVFPTLSDPFANVCLEALACGLPVMTTNSNGAAEILSEGKNGYVLSADLPLTVQIVESVLNFAALSMTQRRILACEARRTAEQFTIRSNAEQTLAVLNSLSDLRRG